MQKPYEYTLASDLEGFAIRFSLVCITTPPPPTPLKYIDQRMALYSFPPGV